jgi:acyl carrier protein
MASTLRSHCVGLLGVPVVSDIAAEFRDILVFHLGAEKARLGDAVRLADLGADSLDLVEIVMSCEERFAIELPNQSASHFKTVGEAIRFIEEQVAAPARVEARSVGLHPVLR